MSNHIDTQSSLDEIGDTLQLSVIEILQALDTHKHTLQWVPRWISQMPRSKDDPEGNKRDLLFDGLPINREIAIELTSLAVSHFHPKLLYRRNEGPTTIYGRMPNAGMLEIPRYTEELNR